MPSSHSGVKDSQDRVAQWFDTEAIGYDDAIKRESFTLRVDEAPLDPVPRRGVVGVLGFNGSPTDDYPDGSKAFSWALTLVGQDRAQVVRMLDAALGRVPEGVDVEIDAMGNDKKGNYAVTVTFDG